MTAVLVWVLMTYTGSESGIQYSPPVQDLASCQRLEAVVKNAYGFSKCVQINMMVAK